MKPVKHSLLPFTIEPDVSPGRYLKRDNITGYVEATTSTEYLLGSILMKLYPEEVSVYVTPEAIAPTSSRVNLNTADAEAIASLPALGIASATKIVEHRDTPYTDLDDLIKRCGLNISQSKRKELADKVEF